MANPQDAANAFPEGSKLVYECVLFFWKVVCNIFFREVRPRGAYNIPRTGPVILVVAPHSNQFLDPLLVAWQVHRETRRRTRFLAAAASVKRKFVGFFIRLMSSIPVSRAADDAKPAVGLIYLDESDSCLVRGIGTSFQSDFTPRMQIMLPKALGSVAAEVVEVVSDTELKIKREFGGESGKGTAKLREKVEEARQAGEKGLPYRKLPFVDQEVMYRYVYHCLKEGGCMGIFPEGGSHDRTDLLPLKAGVSLMALGAMASDPNCKVKVVPVGLSYFHAHRFRSRAVVEFGSAMDVPQELVDMFKQGGAQKREATAKLLDLIYDALKTVTLRAPDYDTLMVTQAARRLYNTPGQHLSLGQVVELNRRFLEGYIHFKNEPRIKALRENVLKYNRLLRDLGMRDHQVPRARRAAWKTFGLLLYRLGLLIVWTLLALPGVVINGPIFLVASIMSKKKAKEALAASNVKVQARDVIATWKVLISLGLAPILYGFYAFLATAIAIQAGASLQWKILTPILLVATLPFIGFAALKFGEAGMDVLKSLRPLIVALVPGQQRSLGRLKQMRATLSNELVDVINTFGPQYFEDFDEWRILVPSSKPPPSSKGPPLLRVRQPSVGPGGSQGGLLVHPMTWLDERLFGWSSSSRRGTSAWAGWGNESSQVPTPEESESEDEGDYDNVLGYLAVGDGGTASPGRMRSRAGSYNDLQKLKHKHNISSPVDNSMSPDSNQAKSSQDGLRTRHGRKSSLAYQAPVERIGAVDKNEPLQSVTDDLNREAGKAPL